MIKLYKNGAWLTEGQEPVSDETGLEQKFHLSKQEAKKNTIAYSILKNHNTSENMDFLKLKFDKLTSHFLKNFHLTLYCTAIGNCSQCPLVMVHTYTF